MTNAEKRELASTIKQYRRILPNGSIFNLTEVWCFLKEETGISFNDSTIRNYLKAFGGKAIDRGQWIFSEELLKSRTEPKGE